MVVFTEPTPRFTPAQRWSFKNNAICGICLGQWLPLLWCFGVHVEWRAYWQRVAFVTVLAGLNSLLAAVEAVWHGRAIARQRIHPRPLFVLGHPRTGTTLLHSLLALDDELGTCSTFCAGFPSSFLWFERFKWLLSGMIDAKRPMDNVELSFDSPQEREREREREVDLCLGRERPSIAEACRASDVWGVVWWCTLPRISPIPPTCQCTLYHHCMCYAYRSTTEAGPIPPPPLAGCTTVPYPPNIWNPACDT
jgi:hypothetical protein